MSRPYVVEAFDSHCIKSTWTSISFLPAILRSDYVPFFFKIKKVGSFQMTKFVHAFDVTHWKQPKAKLSYKEPSMNTSTERLMRKSEVLERTGLKQSTMYYLINKSEFPAPVKLSKRAVAWKESEVRAWIQSRPPVKEL